MCWGQLAPMAEMGLTGLPKTGGGGWGIALPTPPGSDSPVIVCEGGDVP